MEHFGLDLDALKQPAIVKTFRAWLEDWARFLTKYTHLVFIDPDTYVMFTVVAQNCEFCCERETGGWHLLCKPGTNNLEMEGWAIVLVNELIGTPKQSD